KHSTNNGLPRILVHRQTQADMAQIKAANRGQKMTVKGRLYALAMAGKSIPALVAYEVAVEGAPAAAPDQPKALSTFATADYPYYPKLLAVLNETIHAKMHRDKRYTLLIPYRGHEQATPDILQALPALRGKPCWRLRLAHGDLSPEILVLAPDAEGKVARALEHAEPGDTLILRCRIAALNESKNYIEVVALELPPLLPP
ncbi:MAG: hypothetical protein N3A66_07330, partial [Planctomycetota bacterium]|nr:hypothetical protein [Planctomycetota bacterium]